MDIVICRAKYPNDDTGNTTAHQHFVAYQNAEKDEVVLIPLTSAHGKDRHIYYDIEHSKVRDHIMLFKGDDQLACNFNKPTFIDCRNSFRLKMDDTVDLERLTHRDMPANLKQAILEKVYQMKSQNRHTERMLDLKTFKNLNVKAALPRKKQSMDSAERQIRR